MKLTEYKKETNNLTSERDDTYSVYTVNAALKSHLIKLLKKYQDLCCMGSKDEKKGCQSYIIDEARLSIRLTAPYSEERCKVACDGAKNDSDNK